MKFPDRLHKDVLGVIICRGAIDFIKNEKDFGQDEEEDSKNDGSVLSSDEEK